MCGKLYYSLQKVTNKSMLKDIKYRWDSKRIIKRKLRVWTFLTPDGATRLKLDSNKLVISDHITSMS